MLDEVLAELGGKSRVRLVPGHEAPIVELRAMCAQLHPGRPSWSDEAIEAYRRHSRDAVHKLTETIASREVTALYIEFLARCGGMSWQGADDSTLQVFGLGLYESDALELALREFERYRVFPQVALPIARFYGPSFDLCGWHFAIIEKARFQAGQVVELVYASEIETAESLAMRLRSSDGENASIRVVAPTLTDWVKMMASTEFTVGR